MKTSYTPRYPGISSLLMELFLLCISFYIMAATFEEYPWHTGLLAAVSLLFWPDVFLWASYFKASRNKTILIEDDLLTIKSKDSSVWISKFRIKQLEFVRSSQPSKSSTSGFSYVRIKTDEDTHIITHMNCPMEVIEKFFKRKTNDYSTFYPFLNKRFVDNNTDRQKKKKSNQRIAEFMDTYQDYSDEELERISKSDDYRNSAKIAALKVLKTRKL